MSESPLASALSDAYAPPQIARLVEDLAVRKMRLSLLQTVTLGILGGAFISLGAMFYTVVVTGSTLGYGPARLLGGAAFSMGLILVLIGGAELFTGNNLLAIAWADRRITTAQILRNWAVVYCANFVGALATAVLAHLAAIGSLDAGAVGRTAAEIATSKTALTPEHAFFRGVLCNALVCLAVWLCMAARRVSGKILAIAFPISAFVALGFEHSVANMYLIPFGMLAAGQPVAIGPLLSNLVPVTLGNIVGGSVLVALVYWLIYVRGERATPPAE